MLGVLRRHFKPNRNGRKNKNKSTLDGSRDLSNIPRETTRPPRAVRDTRQVHPQEPEKINVIGKDCTIVVTNYGDHWETLSKDCKESKEPDIWQLNSQQFVFDEIRKDSLEDFRDTPIPSIEGCRDIDCPVEYNSKGSTVEDQKYGYFVKGESSKYFQTNVTFDESSTSSENCKGSTGSEERDGHSEPSSSCIEGENVVEQNLNGSSIVSKKNIEKHLNGFCGYVNTKECDSGYWSKKNGECFETVHFAEGLPESQAEVSKFEVEREKTDSIKNAMERKIAEIQCLLEQERENVRQEKRSVTQLQREMYSNEGLRVELEIEKMHRLEAEACLREVRLESEHCKARLASLQEDFLKMEEMVKNMLQFKSRIDQLKHEKSSLALAYESKMRKYQTCLASLEKENLMLLNELRSLEGSNKDHEQKREQTLCRVLLERLGLLEQENTALIIENEQQRLQYEHCLDDVANQVVQALLTQKSLREECGKLQRRVQDLEQQNNALSVLFKQQVLHSGEFHSQLYHRDSLQKIWPSTDNSPDQDTVDLILADRLQNLEFGQYNQNQSQRTGRNFQSHANHSEDSTDSLASLCSDYSFNSGCSGRNVLSYPGLPKMSSPPQWSRDSLTTLGYSVKPQVSSTGVLARSLLTSTPQGCHRTSMTKCWSDLVPRPSDQDCYSRDEVCNYALQAEQLELRESHKLHKSYGNRNMLVDKVCGRLKSDVARSSSLLDSEIHQAEYNLSSQSQSVDLGSLDTIETPSEHILTLESLPYLSSSQRLLISKECNFPNVSQTYQAVQTTAAGNADVYHKSSTNRHSSCLPQQLQHNYFALPSSNRVSSQSDACKSEPSIQRPTTLNVVPHVQCETSHSFSFPALEQKFHDTCVNVYEEVDPPSFSTDSKSVSRISTDANSMASPSRKSLENWYTSESSPKMNSLGEECTNTVIRRSQVGHGTSEDIEYCTMPKESQNISFSEVKTEVQPEPIPVSSPHKSMKECSEAARTMIQHPETNYSKEMQQSNITIHSSERQDSISSRTCTANTSLVPVERSGKDEGYSTMSSDVQTEVNMASNSVENNQDHTIDTDPAPPKYIINAVDVDSAMVSSSDSGLGLLQGPQSQKQLSENHEDGCVGFERELDSSLIRSERFVSSAGKKQVTRVSPTSPKNYDKDRIHFDSGLGDSPPVLRLSSFSESEKKSSLQSNQSSLDSSYDKIINLLTPQGFKAGRSDMRRVTYPAIKLPTSCQIETAEKSTSIDLLCLGLDFHSDSSLSLSSVGSGGRLKVLKGQKDNHQVWRGCHKFSCSESSIGMKNKNRNLMDPTSISSVEADYIQKTFGEDSTYQNIHCGSALMCPYPSTYKNHIYHSRCQSCLEWPVDPLAINSSNIRKFISDSCLYIKEHAGYLFQDLMKLDHPLEHHSSAQNLTYPPPVSSSGIIPGLRRTHCRVLVDQRQSNTKFKHPISPKTDSQQRKKHEQDPPHSVSLSSIQSSASGHSSSEEYEECDLPNLKYSRDYYLSSESEDEYNLLEHQSFVQQWLQEDNSQLQESIKNLYSYDEEEIGNWTFQLSIEDVSQPACDSWDLTLPVQEHFNKIHLGRIQEESSVAEDVYQEELWNNTLWTDSIGQQELPHILVATNNDSNPKLTDIPTCEKNYKDMIDSPYNDEFNKSCHSSMSTSFKANSVVLLNERINKKMVYPKFFKSVSLPNLKVTWNITGEYENHQEHRMNKSTESDVNEKMQNKEPSSGVNEEENCDDEVIPTDTSEFNRDFYRLCPLGSNKSLNDSPKTLPKSKPASPIEHVSHTIMPLLQKSYSKDLDSSPEDLSKYKEEDSLKQKESSTESLSTLKEQCSKNYVNSVKSSPNSETVNMLEEKGSSSINLLSLEKHIIQGHGDSSNPEQGGGFIEDLSVRKQELTSLSDEYPEAILQGESVNVSQQVNISLEMLAQKQFATNLNDSPNNISDSEPFKYIEQNDLDTHQNTGIDVSYSCVSERELQAPGEQQYASNPCEITSNSSVLKEVPHQDVESELHNSKSTILQQVKDKVYRKESSRKQTPSKVQDKKIAQNISVEVKDPKEFLNVKGIPAQDLCVVSKQSHKIPSKKSRGKAVFRNSDFQSPIHFHEKEKLNTHDKSKIPIITKSPTHRRSHSSINSVNFIISSDKQNIDKRQQVVKDKDCNIKYPQFQHQVAQQVGQSHSRLNGSGRKNGSPGTRRNSQKYGFRREFESEGKDIKVFLKEKPKWENKSREDVHIKQKYSNQPLEKDSFPKKEKGKYNFKDLLMPKENVTFNFENVPDLSVADKIQHLNSLLAESEKERTSLILSLKQSEIHRPELVQEHPSTESALEMAFHACRQETEEAQGCCDKEGCGTSWIHVEADVDLSDPKARAKLLDSMMASSSSSNSEEDDDDEVQEHQHNQRLHALHRFRRQKKRASNRDGVIGFMPKIRTSIINSHNFFYRFGEKEREAVACFDFLDEFSTSPSEVGSSEVLNEEKRSITPVIENNNVILPQESIETSNILHPFDVSVSSFAPLDHLNLESALTCANRRLTESCLSSMTLLSQDGESVDHISFSDSCAESYSSSTHSLNRMS